MAVASHVAVLKLVNINGIGAVVDKSDPATTLQDIVKAPGTEFRVVENGTGAAESLNAVGFKTVAAYLEAEASSGYALAHMDQTWIITQMIT
tara:strand:- start:68875 stop:69150 length:276 start_codon:yes stop_codon:yes gene_type:complete